MPRWEHRAEQHGRAITPNDGFRFLLEIAAVLALGHAGWRLGDGGGAGLALATVIPLAAAGAWGTFRVDGDPGPAPVPVHGAVRLAIEAVVFGGAVLLLAVVGRGGWAIALGLAVAVHYLFAMNRVRWLLRQPASRRGSPRRES